MAAELIGKAQKTVQTGEEPEMNGKWISILTIVTALVAISSAQAATFTWTGGSATDPTSYLDGDNWDGEVTSGSTTYYVPRNQDYGDFARFAENSPANKTPTLSSNRAVQGINFADSTGWNFGGSSTLTLREIKSSGTGTNTISASIKTYQGNLDWTVGAGNTLVLTRSIYQDGSGRRVAVAGGGTMHLESQVGGWSSSNSFRIDDATLRVDGSKTHSNGGTTYLNHENAVLELMSDVASVQTLITNSSVVDNTGNGLSVTDLGNGYVQVSVVPEPATMGLLALGGLALIRRKRN